MSREERLQRVSQIEGAILRDLSVGNIYELETIINSTYQILGPAFFGGLEIDQQDFSKVGGKSPSDEIVKAVHYLIDWHVLEMTGDRRLKVNKKNRI